MAGLPPVHDLEHDHAGECRALLDEAGYTGNLTRIGITRAYATRHGAGPLVTEDAALTRALPDASNSFGAWQRGFRVGWLDLVMLKYALEVVGPLDQLAVTCLDRLAELPDLRICRRYSYDTFSIDRIARSPVPHDAGVPGAHHQQPGALHPRA